MYNVHVQCPISLNKATYAYTNSIMYALNHNRDGYDMFVMIFRTVNFEGKPGTCEWKSKQLPKSTRQAGASKSSLDCHNVLTWGQDQKLTPEAMQLAYTWGMWPPSYSNHSLHYIAVTALHQP